MPFISTVIITAAEAAVATTINTTRVPVESVEPIVRNEVVTANFQHCTAYQRHCYNGYDNVLLPTIVGYNVVYVKDGKRYRITMANNPGPFLTF